MTETRHNENAFIEHVHLALCDISFYILAPVAQSCIRALMICLDKEELMPTAYVWLVRAQHDHRP